MSRGVSRAAIKARALNLAPEAMGVLEDIIGKETILCADCEIEVKCPDCGKGVEKSKADKLAMDAALNLLKIADVGPSERNISEKGLPSTPRELVAELLETIPALSQSELKDVILLGLESLEETNRAVLVGEIKGPTLITDGSG